MSAIEWPWSTRLRPVLQSEAAECGLASLVMVARHHGHHVDLVGLRQQYPTSMKGMTLRHLMAVASELELAPRAVRLDVGELSLLTLPAILHWDLNHFVVIEALDGSTATILDPAMGRRRVPLAKMGRHFTGVALELSPTANFKPVTLQVRTKITDLWSRLVNFRGPMAQVFALSLVIQLAGLLTPFFMQLVIDEGVSQGDVSLLLMLVVGFSVIFVLQAVTGAVRSWVSLCLAQSLSFQLSGNIIRHLLRLPVPYFERRHVGDLLSRIGSIQPVQALLTTGIVNGIIDSLLLLTTLVVMAMLSVQLTFIAVGMTLLVLVVNQLMYPALRQRTEEEIVARASEETYLLESIRSIRAIKLHSHEAVRENGWRNRHADVVSAGYHSRMIGIRIGLIEEILLNLSFLVTVYYGAVSVVDQTMTVGMLLAFLAYRSSFSASAGALIDQLQNWRLLGVHLERLSDIVAQQKEDIKLPPPRRLLPGPAIRIADLTYAYDGNENPVLDAVSLTIPRGSFVAIIGPSGAGKTTLMRIMLGLLDIKRGSIEIDGVPLGPATMASWRARIGAVMQDDYLLTGTFADNISFFDPQPDQSQVEQVARFARIHDDITAMSMGYHSLVSDMGAALSAGQRQRMLLARAMYRDPDVLFLDEGTANLDPKTETAIADAIAALPITRIIIAHRPALVKRADIVIRVAERKITIVEDKIAAAAAIDQSAAA